MSSTSNKTVKFPEYRPDGRNFSSVNITLARRINTVAALMHCSSMILLPCLYFYLWTKEKLWPFLILYTIYSYYLDDTLAKGNSVYRTSNWFKRLFIFKRFVDYFPVYTHRTIPLPPSMNYITGEFLSYPEWSFYLPSNIFFFLKSINFTTEKKRIITKEEKIGPKYLFACHPHGVISFGITASLCWGGEDNVWDTKVSDCSISEPFNDVNENDIKSSHKLKSSKSFRSLFPGISNHLLTIPTQFSLPFYRDYIMALGVGLVTKSGISSILRKNHSVTIVVGGAHESLYAKPGANKIVLNRRKGFIRIALELCTKTEEDIIHLTDEEISDNIYNGRWNNSMSDIAIVPVYVFGENNVHNVFNTTEEISENSEIMKTLLKLQLLMKKYTGFTLPLVNSRGVFNYDFGLLPYKRRMDVVTGEPIYIYRKFSKSIKDKVTDEEIDYYHEIYRNKLVELWEKHKGFATEWDENLEIVE